MKYIIDNNISYINDNTLMNNINNINIINFLFLSSSNMFNTFAYIINEHH